MLSAQIGKYVMPQILRKYYNIFSPVVLVGLGSFSFLMWYVALTQNHTQLPCGIVAIIFTGITIYSTFKIIYISKQMLVQYSIDRNEIRNIGDNYETCISINSELFFSLLSVTFSIGNSHIEELFLVFSNSPFPSELRFVSQGTDSIELILNKQLVIVPLDYSDPEQILTQRVKTYEPALFPRVSYLPPAS